MCQVKTGEQIREINDVQNLVTALILKSRQPYTIASMIKNVTRNCEGSTLNIPEDKISQLVRETTAAFLRTNYIFGRSGQYLVRPVLYKYGIYPSYSGV